MKLVSYVLTAELEVDDPMGTIDVWWNTSYHGFTLRFGACHVPAWPDIKKSDLKKYVEREFPGAYSETQFNKIYQKLRRLMRRMKNAKVTVET